MAAFVLEISLAFLSAMSLLLGLLIGRRWLDERRAAGREAKRRAATKAYLAGLKDPGSLPLPTDIPVDLQQEAVSHLLQLLRGSEKDSLLDLAEEQGLFGPAIAAAYSRRPAKRAEAIRTLEQFGSPKCVQALTNIMANDSSGDVRLAAAAALARLEALPSARDTVSLLQLDRQPPILLHGVLFRSLAVTCPKQLRELLRADCPAALRVTIIDALAYGGDMEDIGELEMAARDADAEVRAAALRAANQLGDHRAGPWVVQALDDPAEIVRIQAAKAAAGLGLRAAVPKLENMLHDPSPWVRMRAGDALASLAPRRAAGAA